MDAEPHPLVVGQFPRQSLDLEVAPPEFGATFRDLGL